MMDFRTRDLGQDCVSDLVRGKCYKAHSLLNTLCGKCFFKRMENGIQLRIKFLNIPHVVFY